MTVEDKLVHIGEIEQNSWKSLWPGAEDCLVTQQPQFIFKLCCPLSGDVGGRIVARRNDQYARHLASYLLCVCCYSVLNELFDWGLELF